MRPETDQGVLKSAPHIVYYLSSVYLQIMFTGLVENIGTLDGLHRSNGGWRLNVGCRFDAAEPLVMGESIAVQGACLTVSGIFDGGFAADLLDETLGRTALGSLRKGAPLNLERALRAGDRLGGHIVQGHVDEVGRVELVRPAGRDSEIRISCSSLFSRQCVVKGSVAIDGVSLTITSLGDGFLAVNIIPHTLKSTSLSALGAGSPVNLESDVLGKYVYGFLRGRDALDEEKLRRAGFCG